MGKNDKKAKETSRWKGHFDDNYNTSLTNRTTIVSNIQLNSNFDENPPAYHTMYPGILNQQEDHMQQQQQNKPLDQSQELAMLRPSHLLALQLPVFSSSKSFDENKNSGKGSKRKKSNSENDKTNANETENIKTENNSKASRPIGRLERRITLSEFSKSTQDMIVTKAMGIRQIAAFALKDFCRTTTAHGFRHSLEPNLHVVFRAFWLIITLGSLGLLVYMAYQVTYAAFVIRRPTTEVNYHDNRTTGVSFPDITICSLSGFWKSKLAKYNVSKSLASYITLSLRGPDLVGQVLLRDQRIALLRKLEFENYMKKTNLTITELTKLLSPTCEEVIAACYSEGLVPYYECCKEVLRTVVTPLGVCYSTLGNDRRKFNQTLSGLIGGVRIIFSVSLHEYMVHDANVVSSAWLAEEGIHVSVSDYTMTPTVSTNMQAIRIAPNSAASLALSLTTVDHSDVYHSDWPWEKRSPCLRRTDYWQLTEEEMAYTENNLYFTLLYRDCAMEHSNCTLIPFRFANDTSPECTPHQVRQLSLWKDIKKCALEKLKNFNQDGKRLCFTTTINQQLSYTNLYKESLQALQDTDQLAKGNLSMVNIFYTRLGYTELFERTPNFLTWFSDLGGQMGLFLGASFITLVELFFILFYLIRVVTYWAMKTLYVQIKKFFSPQIKSNTPP